MSSLEIIPHEINTRASITIFMSWESKNIAKGCPSPTGIPSCFSSTAPSCSKSTPSQQQQQEPQPDIKNHCCYPSKDCMRQFGKEDRTTKWGSLPKSLTNFVTFELSFWNLKNSYVYVCVYMKWNFDLIKNGPGEGRSVICPSWSTT